MSLKIEDIFMPSVGVDLVFDMNSTNPISRSSIIYDTDFEKKTITIAQPLRPITGTTVFDQLHLTTILFDGKRKIRAGIQCHPIQFDDHYRLANQAISKVVVLKYTSEAAETNIRSAFRLPLSQKFTIKAKMIYHQVEYYTTKNFTIKDISFTGMGLVAPKKETSLANPLIELKKNEIIPIGLILINKGEEKPIGAFPLKTMVVRVNKNYSESHILVGLKILKISQKNEITLNRFIHNAQVDELKRLRTRTD